MSSNIFNSQLMLHSVFSLVFLKSVYGLVFANETTLIFHYGPNFGNSTVYKLSDVANMLNDSNFKNNQTHMYFNGWNETQNAENVRSMIFAYSKRKNINFLTVDWAKAAAGDYVTVATTNIELVALALSDAILNLFDAGLDRQSLTLVAVSLGCQLAGLTSRYVIAKSNGAQKIYKMALLDVAYQLFSPSEPILPTVNQNDAEFVQAIHTDSDGYGEPLPLGHVDFWPNGGLRVQPGCPLTATILSNDDYCSHERAWELWMESVANVDGKNPKFLGYPSLFYEMFLQEGETNKQKKTVEMGIDCPMSASGNYYLTTNNQSIYARGTEGYNFN